MIAAHSPSVDTSEWRAFLSLPAAYAHGVHLAACLGDNFEVEFCEQLLATERLHSRLSELLTQHYDLPDWREEQVCDAEDRVIAMATAEQIDVLAARSGAIYWSANIAGAILAHEAEAFQQQLGHDLCSYAVVHRDLAGPKRDTVQQDDLHNVVLTDGWRCIEAWRRNLPESIGKRVLLKLAPNPLFDMQPDRIFDEFGPAIVRRAANVGGVHG